MTAENTTQQNTQQNNGTAANSSGLEGNELIDSLIARASQGTQQTGNSSETQELLKAFATLAQQNNDLRKQVEEAKTTSGDAARLQKALTSVLNPKASGGDERAAYQELLEAAGLEGDDLTNAMKEYDEGGGAATPSTQQETPQQSSQQPTQQRNQGVDQHTVGLVRREISQGIRRGVESNPDLKKYFDRMKEAGRSEEELNDLLQTFVDQADRSARTHIHQKAQQLGRQDMDIEWIDEAVGKGIESAVGQAQKFYGSPDYIGKTEGTGNDPYAAVREREPVLPPSERKDLAPEEFDRGLDEWLDDQLERDLMGFEESDDTSI